MHGARRGFFLSRLDRAAAAEEGRDITRFTIAVARLRGVGSRLFGFVVNHRRGHASVVEVSGGFSVVR